MKKLLLLLFTVTFGASAQTYWNPKATTFPIASSGVTQISYADASSIWIYAYDGSGATNPPAVYRTWGRSTDGGDVWTSGTINLGTTSTSLGIGSIDARTSTTSYVAAYPNAAGVFGGIWRTTTSGVTWVKQASASFNFGADSFTNFVTFFNATDGVCAGDPAPATAGGTVKYFEIYTTTNGGVTGAGTWTRVPSANIPAPLAGEYGYVHNFTKVGNTIWFGTNKGRLFKSVDKGLNWTVSQTPLTDMGGADDSGNYAFKDQNNGLLISGNWGFWRTTDGGATWVAESPNGVYRNGALCYVPGTVNTYVSLGTDLEDSIRGSSYSTDGGLNWISMNGTVVANNVNGTGAVAFFSPTVGLAAGFTTSATAGGIFKFVGTQLATVNFDSAKAITASPNPTTGILELSGLNISQVAVYDILGKQISNESYSALNAVTLNLSSLNTGIYMVKVTNDSGKTSTIKVIKE